MSKGAFEGQREARTPPETPGAGPTAAASGPAAAASGPVTAGRAALTADFRAMAAAMALDDDGQADLLTGSPDLDDADSLAQAAKSANEGRRARGRPAGSQNRRNADVFAYLEALGHRNPLVTLSLYQSADVHQLAALLECEPLDAAKLQIAAAKEIAPYGFAKRPQAIELTKRELHVFLAGDYDTALPADAGGEFDLTNGAGPVMDHDEHK